MTRKLQLPRHDNTNSTWNLRNNTIFRTISKLVYHYFCFESALSQHPKTSLPKKRAHKTQKTQPKTTHIEIQQPSIQENRHTRNTDRFNLSVFLAMEIPPEAVSKSCHATKHKLHGQWNCYVPGTARVMGMRLFHWHVCVTGLIKIRIQDPNKYNPPEKLTWHWKIPIFKNRKYILNWWMFGCHVSFLGVVFGYINSRTIIRWKRWIDHQFWGDFLKSGWSLDSGRLISLFLSYQTDLVWGVWWRIWSFHLMKYGNFHGRNPVSLLMW